MITPYKIAEQCRVITEKRVPIQVLVSEVIDALGVVAKKIWFEQIQYDEQSIDGELVNTFTNLQPILDDSRNKYYIILPSRYLMLPHQAGIQWVSLMQDEVSWVRVQNWGIYSQLKSAVMGDRQVYEIEGTKMWFPKMTSETACPILLKLAVAYDNIDPYEPLNIGPNVVNDVVNVVVAPYMNKQNPEQKVREIIS